MRFDYFGQAFVADQADRAVAEIERQYLAGSVKVGLSPDTIIAWLVAGPAAAFPFVSGWFTTSQEKAVQKNMKVLGERIKTWKTTYRRWATQGKRDDGTPYSWASWIDYGTKVLASEIKYQTNEAWDASAFVTLAKITAKTAEDAVVVAKKIIDQAEKMAPAIPDMLKWIAGAVVVGGAAYILSPFIMAGRRVARG